MIELGVNAAIIIALGATLRIMGDTAEAPEADPSNAPEQDEEGQEPVPVGVLRRNSHQN